MAAAAAWCSAAPQRCSRAGPGVPGSGTVSAAPFLQESAPAHRERQEEGKPGSEVKAEFAVWGRMRVYM